MIDKPSNIKDIPTFKISTFGDAKLNDVPNFDVPNFNVIKMRQCLTQQLCLSNRLDEQTRHRLSSPDTWWLLSTQGCHLCEQAQKTLETFNKVYPIEFITIDIMDLEDNDSYMTQFAPYIPVLLSSSTYLYGSFSVVDLQKLV